MRHEMSEWRTYEGVGRLEVELFTQEDRDSLKAIKCCDAKVVVLFIRR